MDQHPLSDGSTSDFMLEQRLQQERYSLANSLTTDIDIAGAVDYLLRIRKHIAPRTANIIALSASKVRARATENIEQGRGTFWYLCFVVDVCNDMITECAKSRSHKKA